jgi:DNA-binding LacI/PurR family transcriptional regulator
LAILRARQDSPCFFKLLAQAADAELLNIGGALGPHGTAAHANAALLSGADGAVVLGRCKPALLEKLQKLEIPIVCTGLNRVDAPVDQVLCDGRAIASEATEHLLRMGHHQIGYVGESRRESRFLGYRRALLEQGICTRPELVFEAPLTEEGGFCAAKRVAATLPQVTAFFCANDAVGIGLLRGLKELVPTRPLPALLSVDNTGSANVAHPLLSTVDIPVREMGRVAVRLLADRLAGGHVLPQTVFLPYSFLWRESCQKK